MTRFPKDKEKCKLWCSKLGMDMNRLMDHHRICSKHFSSSDFQQNTVKKVLKPTALPVQCSSTNNLRYSSVHWTKFRFQLIDKNLFSIVIDNMSINISPILDLMCTYTDKKTLLSRMGFVFIFEYN